MTSITHSPHPHADDHDEAAQLHARQDQAFRIHVGVFAATMVAIFIVNFATNLAAGIADEWQAWWTVWALLGWSIGIAVHGLVVRLNRPPIS